MEKLTVNPLQFRQFQVKGNFFKFSSKQTIYKYKCEIIPNADLSVALFFRIQRSLKQKLNSDLGSYLPLNMTLYSESKGIQRSYETNLDGKDYKFSIECMGKLDEESSAEQINFLGRSFKMIQAQLGLILIQRKYFNVKKKIPFPEYNLEVLPGYQTALRQFGVNSNIFINIDASFKILNKQNMNTIINEFCSKTSLENVQHQLAGKIIMTKYNQRMYRVDHINFDLNPSKLFTTSQGDSKSLEEYYKQRYHLKITDCKQPLIVNKDRKTGREIFLIPEFCNLTGLDDAMRNNYNLMKNLATATKPDANKRLELSRELIRNANQQKQEKNAIFLEMETEPQTFQAWQIPAVSFIIGNLLIYKKIKGEYLLGKENNNQSERIQIKIDGSHDLDRKMQTVLYQSQVISKWAIFAFGEKNQALETFVQTFQQSLTSYKYPIKGPKVFKMKSRNFEDWKAQMANLDEVGCQGVILILPGQKKAAPLYNDLKRFLIQEKGIPSQVVIESTLKGKGVRSICNKVLVQFCAKTGGIPWVMNQMPFTKEPTMVVGIDVYHKTFGNVKKSIFAFVATVDINFSRYYSIVKVQETGQEIGSYVEECCSKALQDFYNINKHQYPKNVFVFRDGVSQSQRAAVQSLEIEPMRRSFEKACNNIKLVFLCLDKRTSAKFYTKVDQKSVSNCQPGTVIDDPKLCTYEEFYLISQKTPQGIAQPTHFYALANDLAEKASSEEDKISLKKNIELLSYKLCYLYYNWTGSIKVPAPCNYAHKLSNLVGDKWSNMNFHAHPNLAKQKSLYFI